MINDLMESPPSTVETALSPEERDDVFIMPCTVSQKRFWLLDQMTSSSAFNIPILLQLTGPLRLDLLEQALQAMIRRHEILRTHFAMVDGEVKQIVSSRVGFSLDQMDLSALEPEERSRRLGRETLAEAEKPINLAEAPLLRVTVVRLGSRESVLMLTAHHIISDGWSNGVLVRELGLFYDALLHGREADLPPLEIQYADYVLWQEEWLKTPEFQKQLDYWKSTLAGELPVLDFPADFPRQSGQCTEAVLESLLLPLALTDRLKRFCLEEGVTLFMVFYAVYLVVLHRYTGQAQLIVGTTAANRNQPHLENLIGLFANIQILRSDLSGEMPFREFLLRQRDQVIGSFTHHEAPFELVLEHLQQRRNGVPRTLLQTHFLYQRAFMQPSTCGELTIRPLYSISPGSTFELTYGIVERAEGIRLQMEYRTSLFKASTIRHLLLHFQAILESIMAHPEMPLGDLPMDVAKEREEWESALRPSTGLASVKAAVFDPSPVLADLDRQLEAHLKMGVETFAPISGLPSGAVLVVLDQQLRRLPVGIPGDLYLGHRSAPLKASSGHEPVTGPAGMAPLSLLKTDFVGRNAEAGRVELWGRSADLVRIASFRSNLRAIEAQLRIHPDVADAAVTLDPEKSQPVSLIGYAVLRPDATISGEGLRAWLRGKLSEGTLPTAIVIVPSLPRNSEGAILVEHLPAPSSIFQEPVSDHAPALGILHQQLMEIWQDILKTPEITIHDNFFECGGNSFLALRMMIEVGKLCGRPVPLSLLLTGATIAHLARFITQEHEEREGSSSLIPLQTRGSRPPLFFLHGDWAGGGFYCKHLSRQLGEDQPFFALPPYRTLEERILSLEEMARFHCSVLRRQSPRGPYLLGGYCIGALVAMEMARQLQEEGETVAQLFLVDPTLWSGWELRLLWPWVDRVGRLRHSNLEKRIDLFDRSVVMLHRWLRSPMKSKVEILRRRLGGRNQSRSSVLDDSVDGDVRDATLLEGFDYSLYFLAYRLYKFRALSVPATLFFPESTSGKRLSQVASASRMDAAKFKIEMLPGNHTTCVTKHTSVLVDKMRAVIGSL